MRSANFSEVIWLVANFTGFPHRWATLQLSFSKKSAASRALLLVPSWPCDFSVFVRPSFGLVSTLSLGLYPLFPTAMIGSCFILICAFENGPVLVVVVDDFWNACVVCLICSNLLARFSTSSGVNVSNVSVPWSTAFLIRDINKSLTSSASNTPSSAFAACAVNAAWNDSKDPFVSCDRVNNLIVHRWHFSFFRRRFLPTSPFL